MITDTFRKTISLAILATDIRRYKTEPLVSLNLSEISSIIESHFHSIGTAQTNLFISSHAGSEVKKVMSLDLGFSSYSVCGLTMAFMTMDSSFPKDSDNDSLQD